MKIRMTKWVETNFVSQQLVYGLLGDELRIGSGRMGARQSPKVAIPLCFISGMEGFLIAAISLGGNNFARFYKRNGRFRIRASNVWKCAISLGFTSEIAGFPSVRRTP